jgi:RNA polymerase sigma-70 factor (ECF subfamily)
MFAYQNGDNSAFDQLYQRHKAPLYRYFLRQSVNRATAEELYQEVWMSLIKARARYRATAKFTTYLYHLAHNKLIDHYRKNKNYSKTVVPDDDGNITGFAQASESDGPEYQLAQGVLLEKLETVLQALPDDQREAFLLKEEGGLSIEEIAEVCQINSETAKSRVRYAVNRLKNALATDEGGK